MTVSEDRVPKSIVVGWIDQGEPRFAAVQDAAAEPWRVGADGRVRVVRRDDCAVVVPARDATAIAVAAADAATAVDPHHVWEALDGAPAQAAPKDWAPRLPPRLGLDAAALWLVLWRAPQLFARVGRTHFRRRDLAEVERERERLAQKHAEQEWLRRLDHEAEAVMHGARTVSDWAQANPGVATALREVAYGEAPDARVPAAVVARARHYIDAAWQAAGTAWPQSWFASKALGDADPWCSGHPRLALRAGALAALPPPPLPSSLPLLTPETALIAVDDAQTSERDDAVGCRDLGDGTCWVEVAIADTSDGFGADDAWLEALAEWATTIYTPGGMVPMVPPSVGLGRHSLGASEARPAWLLRWRLRLADATVLEPPTLLRGGVRLHAVRTYEQIDAGDQHEGWLCAQALAQALEAARTAAGADTIRVPEAEVFVRGGHPVGLKTATPWRGARAVIREMMLLANVAFAERLAAAGLPAPYRGQDSDAPAPRPTRVQLTPLRHPGIGARCYVFGTSPIRRLSDVLVQRQLRATLGEPALDLARLQHLVHRSEAAYADMKRWIEAAARYWKLRYLEAFPDTPLTGVPLSCDDRTATARVRVEPLALLAVVPGAAGPVDQPRPLRIRAVDAEAGRLELAW